MTVSTSSSSSMSIPDFFNSSRSSSSSSRSSSSAAMSIPDLFNSSSDTQVNNNNNDATVDNTQSTSSNKSNRLLIVAYAALKYLPVSGTVIGIKNAIKAHKSEAKLDNWEKAKIITQIFSFLIVPQVILGSAYAIKSLIALIPAPKDLSNGDDLVQDDNQAQNDQVASSSEDTIDVQGLFDEVANAEEGKLEEVEGEAAVSSESFEIVQPKVILKTQSLDRLVVNQATRARTHSV